MNNHQVSFIKKLISSQEFDYYSKNFLGSNINSKKNKIREIKNEIRYLSYKHGVKFYTKNKCLMISFLSDEINIDGHNFGKFSIKIKDRFFLIKNKNTIKHPHELTESFEPNYSEICLGDAAWNNLRKYNYFYMYLCAQKALKNVGLEDAKYLSKYYGDDIIQICMNYDVDNLQYCDSCEGYYYQANGKCGNPDCYNFTDKVNELDDE